MAENMELTGTSFFPPFMNLVMVCHGMSRIEAVCRLNTRTAR